jgi:hypothetical protein
MFGKKKNLPPTNNPQPMAPTPTGRKGEKKWLLWSLIGFTGILLTTAVILFIQINKPAPTPLPSPRPSASPQLPPVQQAVPENVCQDSFTITELECAGITLSPTGTTVSAADTRSLTAQVTGGSGTYNHSWIVTSTGSSTGSLSSTSTNPATWTAPSSLSGSQTWIITDTITDTSTTVQSTTCEITLNFGGVSACFETCDTSADCGSGLSCLTVGGTKRCVNPSCSEDADCSCASPSPSPSVSPTPTPVGQASPTPSPSTIAQSQPELPQAGVSAPAVLGVSAGLLLMLLGLLF